MVIKAETKDSSITITIPDMNFNSITERCQYIRGLVNDALGYICRKEKLATTVGE